MTVGAYYLDGSGVTTEGCGQNSGLTINEITVIIDDSYHLTVVKHDINAQAYTSEGYGDIGGGPVSIRSNGCSSADFTYSPMFDFNAYANWHIKYDGNWFQGIDFSSPELKVLVEIVGDQ